LRLHDAGATTVLRAKWRPWGTALFNDPRKELCAYELQKLVLRPTQYVVPPTIVRCLPRMKVSEGIGEDVPMAFGAADCALGVLSYWLEHASSVRLDEELIAREELGHAVAALNLFTYLILHGDGHDGNFLAELDRAEPSIYSVDNAVSFSRLVRNPLDWFQADWSELRVDSFPSQLVARVRGLTSSDFTALATIAEFQRRGDTWVPVEATAPIDREQGVRVSAERLQIGLTAAEIGLVRELRDDLLKVFDQRG
jgi:hypothetical protein